MTRLKFMKIVFKLVKSPLKADNMIQEVQHGHLG